MPGQFNSPLPPQLAGVCMDGEGVQVGEATGLGKLFRNCQHILIGRYGVVDTQLAVKIGDPGFESRS